METSLALCLRIVSAMAVGFPPKTALELPLSRSAAFGYLDDSQAAFERLGWRIVHATHHRLIAVVPASLRSFGEVFSVRVENDTAILRSRCKLFQPLDFGKNDGNIELFLATLELLQQTPAIERPAYSAMRERAAHEVRTRPFEPRFPGNATARIGLLQSLVPGQGLLVTPLLIYANVLVFLALVISGADLMHPTADSLLAWGANYKPLVAAGEYWRLFASCFLHIGLAHLLINMVSLLLVSSMLEPVVGRARLLLVFIATGIAGSATSAWWNENIISAGASGAIFGLIGMLIVLLLTNQIAHHIRRGLLAGLVLFLSYVFLQGFDQTLDTASHLGGLLAGATMTLILLPGLQRPYNVKLGIGTGIAASAVALLVAGILVGSSPEYYARYDALMQEFSQNEARGMEVYKLPANTSPAATLQLMETEGLLFWQDNLHILDQVEAIEGLPNHLRERTRLLRNYCRLRVSTMKLIARAIQENTSRYDPDIDENERALEQLLERIGDEPTP